MQIRRSNWLYRWHEAISDRLEYCFTGRTTRLDDPDRVNLCPFARTVFLYGPLWVTVHLLAVASLVYVYAVYPVITFGLDYGITLLIIVGGIISIIAGLAIFVIGSDFTAELYKRWRRRRSEDVGVFSLWRTWRKAVHDRFCPTIVVKD